ncbi:patatin-like phospholipase family protein [Massilia sp. NR 4-1]|uniref:patatin-like phospholipase family protein n=1 Tax=Massilia sp. NR 4-1 TaxID=1678028 RepID=UPI00067B665E|nr:patatin-like phospholipase family protein [Massilia sp. NR 4-1]
MSKPSPEQADLERKQDLIRKLDILGYKAQDDFEAALEHFRADEKLDKDDSYKLWQRLNERAGSVFSEVFQYELDAIAGRQAKLAPASLSETLHQAHERKLAGLAFSGGGIRSATFNLGVIQALAELRLLSTFDYLSTVSGGGYIGGWLSKWIKEKGGDVRAVEQELAPSASQRAGRAEPAPIQFLRQYSHYLTPKTGMFSADTWTLICTYLRNTLLNLTMLVAWLSVLFLLPRGVAMLTEMQLLAPSPGTVVGGIAFFLLAIFFIALSISCKAPEPGQRLPQDQGTILYTICLPLIAAGHLSSIAVWQYRHEIRDFWGRLPDSLFDIPQPWHLLIPGLVYFAVWAAGWGCAQYQNARFPRSAPQESHLEPNAAPLKPVEEKLHARHKLVVEGVGHLLCAIGALAVGTLLLLKGVASIPKEMLDKIDAVNLATFGMPLMLLLFGVTITLMIGLVGRMYRDESREWWARQGAWTAIFMLAWSGLFLCTFYMPPLLAWTFAEYQALSSVGALAIVLLAWLGLRSGSSNATGRPGSSSKLELAAKIAPYAFMLIIVAILTTWLQTMVAPPPKLASGTHPLSAFYAAYFKASMLSHGKLMQLLIYCAITAAVLGWRVDINKFSLYMMYRMRLVRAYFGASSNPRAPHPFTGFDAADDIPLHSLLHQRPDGSIQPQRPYHIINTALNLVNGEELAWQMRKAASFSMTPAFCGFEMPALPGSHGDKVPSKMLRGCYRPTSDYASRPALFKDDDALVKLGLAVAVSGAAASPSMGYHSSPPLSFLMTLFNLRLGRWSPNPLKEHKWKQSAPRIGFFSLVAELFGLTDSSANFLYLSDGGHFENLGLYELVRRRCRLIVVVDASADHKFTFDDLGNAIRKCFTDMHVPIRLNASHIETMSGPTPVGAAFVTGEINYAKADGVCENGVLLYIKPTMTGSENADLLNYRKTHADFPHQSTADQWFDEDQFESYRALGYQIGMAALKEAALKSASRLPGSPSHRIGYLAHLLLKQGEAEAPANVLPLHGEEPPKPPVPPKPSAPGVKTGEAGKRRA